MALRKTAAICVSCLPLLKHSCYVSYPFNLMSENFIFQLLNVLLPELQLAQIHLIYEAIHSIQTFVLMEDQTALLSHIPL